VTAIRLARIAGIASNATYDASKGGLVDLRRELAAEWGEFGVNVNAPAPAPASTSRARCWRSTAENRASSADGYYRRVRDRDDLRDLPAAATASLISLSAISAGTPE
jgi:NAD(P)-dependent dehydrogenase (short-subunit alcohol dehydrogenase family)